MKISNLISVEEAIEKIETKFCDMKIEMECIDLKDSFGRILSSNIVSGDCIPDFDRATIDGYALLSTESYGASESVPKVFKLKSKVMMGEEADFNVEPGECAYVPTGGMIPKGCDCVVTMEDSDCVLEDEVAVYNPVVYGQNVIHRGDDIKEGEVILKRGQMIDTAQIGVLASIGIHKVQVFKKIRFYIISTGDEVVDIDQALEKGQIRDVNGYTLMSMIEKSGGETVKRVIVKDDLELLKSEIQTALEVSDIVIVSGGSSIGSKNYVSESINSFEGEGVFIDGIGMRPGRLTLVGEAMKKPVFGLPGHPVSSIVVFKSIIDGFVRMKYEMENGARYVDAKLAVNIYSKPGKDTYQMVKLEKEEGIVYARPIFAKSGMISIISKSCGYIAIPKDVDLMQKDENVKVYFI